MSQSPLILVFGLSFTLLACSDPVDKAEAQPDDFVAGTPSDDDGSGGDDTGTGTDTDTDTRTDTGTDTDSGEAETDSGDTDTPPVDIDGVYEGTISVHLAADPLGTGVMMEETCTGSILANVMQVGEPPIYGSGGCSISEGGLMAALIGTAGPFDGRLTGTIAEDGTPSGAIIIEIIGVAGGVEVDWTGSFEDRDGTLLLTGESEGLLEALTVDMDPGTLVFDVTYSGGFELEQIRTPE